jgi:peptidoglycan-N-acetylglucosamine deacetylase
MNILTFDIEEWFLSKNPYKVPYNTWDAYEKRVESNTGVILELLEKHKIKATFFILGWVAVNYPDLVRRIFDAGHEIGYHTYFHNNLKNFSPETFDKDLHEGILTLEDLTGSKVLYFRAPYFSLTEENRWAYENLAEHGIMASSSMKAHRKWQDGEVLNNPFYVACGGSRILELPLNRLKTLIFNPVFTGSGYFRVLPEVLLKHFYSLNNYTMTYFHPRDFDLQPPYSNSLSFTRNMMNKVGSGSTISKFEHLMQSVRFATVGEACRFYRDNENDLRVFKLNYIDNPV